MLNIYYGNETADKAKFIYENIKGKSLLIVPDQYSLQAEKDAFFYLGNKSFIDLIVVDFSSLGHKVVSEACGREPAMIDKYGRHMLLAKIIGEMEEDLKVFRGQGWKNSFIDMVNSLISEMKRYGVAPQALKDKLEALDGNNYLKFKLEDIEKIYSVYQEQIKDKYLDTEDYIDFYGEKIAEASIVKEADVWIYGFDTFTPKNILIIQRLLKAARSVNVVMTYSSKAVDTQDAALVVSEDNDLYELTYYVMQMLQKAAAEVGESVTMNEIHGDARRSVWQNKENITLAKTSSIYAEADRAAAYILSLVRDEGYRFGDIVVVCNDYELRGNLLRRTFTRWGIPVFMDKKRKVMHHPAVGFLLALMEVLAKGYRDDSVMRMLKSGLMDLSTSEIELLENYIKEFRIRGTMWKKEFTKMGKRYNEKELEELNVLRQKVVACIETAREKLGSRNTVEHKIKGLYFFLEEDFQIKVRLENVMTNQENAGLNEAAAETAQSWNVICNIFDQIIETIGAERISNEELMKLMTAGFAEIEIGLVPASPDCVIIGTLQRTRLNRVKALVVAGANDGIIPMIVKDSGILSDREKQTLENMDLELSKREDVVRQEEKLAIYRTLSLPQDKLYVSCASANEKGEEIRPSAIFTALEEYAAGEVLGDLASCEGLDAVASKEGTLSYVADALREYYSGGKIDHKWIPVIKWYEENEPEELAKIKKGILFDNNLELLGKDFADSLYRGNRDAIEVSSSRLEGYSKCPFAHFIKYGLRADEITTYEMHANDIGTIYHECLMRLSQKLTEGCGEEMDITDPKSPWNNIHWEECRDFVHNIVDNEMAGFREGLLTDKPAEKYRTERLKEICTGIAWSMIRQVQQGQIKEMYFEQSFGRNKPLPPVKVQVGDQEVLIKGTIDRLDVLDSQGGESVRIIDYKTGGDFIDPEYMRNGYKLQLMIYLAAAQKEPAGVFYFKIKDIDIDADRTKVDYDEDITERIASSYKLEGIMVNDSNLLEAMTGQITGSSDVIPVKYSKKDSAFVASSGGHLMTREEFNDLYEEVGRQVNRICQEICDGNISIAPKVEHEKDINGGLRVSCKYCNYKSICMFDTSFDGCRFQEV